MGAATKYLKQHHILRVFLANRRLDGGLLVIGILPLFAVALFFPHGIASSSNVRHPWLAWPIVVAAAFAVAMVVSVLEIRFTRRWLLRAYKRRDLAVEMSVRYSLLVAVIVVSAVWVLGTEIHASDFVVALFGLWYFGVAYIRWSLLSPFHVPMLEILTEGIVLDRPATYGVEADDAPVRGHGGVCFIPWERVQAIEPAKKAKIGPVALSVAATGAIWWKSWRAYRAGGHGTIVEGDVVLRRTMAGSKIPLEAVVDIVSDYRAWAYLRSEV